jgi:hypothetical protein
MSEMETIEEDLSEILEKANRKALIKSSHRFRNKCVEV